MAINGIKCDNCLVLYGPVQTIVQVPLAKWSVSEPPPSTVRHTGWAHSIDGGAYGEGPPCHRGIRRGLSFREWLATVEVMTGQESARHHREPVRLSCDEALRVHRARTGAATQRRFTQRSYAAASA